MKVGRDPTLLPGSSSLDNSCVDPDHTRCVQCSVCKARSHNGSGKPGVERLDLAVGSDILEERADLSPADYPFTIYLGD
jgi:hypothetical protein